MANMREEAGKFPLIIQNESFTFLQNQYISLTSFLYVFIQDLSEILILNGYEIYIKHSLFYISIFLLYWDIHAIEFIS